MVKQAGAITVALVTAGFAVGAASASAQPVLNANDAGAGSLRAAIAAANVNSDVDAITVAIPGAGPHTVTLASNLPAITQPVILDGGGRLVIDAGAAVGDGVVLQVDGSAIRGLVVQNAFDDGLAIQGDENEVTGNLLGTDASGAPAGVGNGGDGVQIDGVANVIGGPTQDARNVVADNGGAGIRIAGPSGHKNRVEGNFVGLDASGTVAAGNADGIAVLGNENVIGGVDSEGSANVIADNSTGVALNGDGNRVEGNLVGTDVTGAVEVGNSDGITIAGDDNVVGGSSEKTGNVISGNSGWGVEVTAGEGNEIFGNLIGPAEAGVFPNQNGGVLIASDRNVIGGPRSGERNVISLNDVGVQLDGDLNRVSSNRIGTTADGSAALGNDTGVLVHGHGNVVGGSAAIMGNLLSGNTTGLEIRSDSSLGADSGTGNTVMGNLIGTTAAGTVAVPNSVGVKIRDASANRIGGGPNDGTDAGNVISGNERVGVELFHDGNGVDDNVIAGNRIGTDRGATRDLGNGDSGVRIDDGNRTLIGGTGPAAANIIAFNDEGIDVESGVDNAFLRNAIHSNSGLAIDLDSDGDLNPIDALDADTGANNLQNSPNIIRGVFSPTSATIDWMLTSEPLTGYRVEFFSTLACGQTRSFLGAVRVTTDANGNVAATSTKLLLSARPPAGSAVTATATKLDSATGKALDTSELSGCPSRPAGP